jgi:FkbM family methyltransferase
LLEAKIMSLSEGLFGYYHNFGLRGVAAMIGYRVVGQPKTIVAHDFSLRFPVRVRCRTSDASVFDSVIKGREYDVPIKDFAPKTIIDAGANVGYASVYFANRYPDAKIIAIEPEAGNFHMLLQNCQSYPNIIPLQAALWWHDGEINLTPEPDSSAQNQWGFRTSEGRGTPAICMGSLMSKFGFSHIDLLKIDIEGAEKEVFESANWLDSISVVAVEFHDDFKPGSTGAFLKASDGRFSLIEERGEATFFVHTTLTTGC